MIEFLAESCPKCGYKKRKAWDDLNDDEFSLVKKLHRNTEFSAEERKTHEFCARCWHEFADTKEQKC